MAQEIKNETVNVESEETQATETKVEQQNAAPAPADQPGAPAQPEKEKTSVWQKVKTVAKKVGKTVKNVVPIVGVGLVAFATGKAIGKACGMEAAITGMNPDPAQPELPGPTDGCGVDTIEDVDFGDVTVIDDPVIDTPAE